MDRLLIRLSFRHQDNDTFAKRLRILAEASLGHGLSPTLHATPAPESAAVHAPPPPQHAKPRGEQEAHRLQPHLQGQEQPQASSLAPRPTHSAPVERRGSGGGSVAAYVPASVSEGSPNLDGLSAGTASGTASIGLIVSRGAGGAAPLQLIRPGGSALADAIDARDGSPESKWATAEPLSSSPHREIAGPGAAPASWAMVGAANGSGGGAPGKGFPLHARPSEAARMSQELQPAQSMSVDGGTPRAHVDPVPSLDPLQQRLHTPEQKEHAHRGRTTAGGAQSEEALRGGMYASQSLVRLLTCH